MQLLNVFALVVGLEAARLEAQLLGPGLDPAFQLLQGEVPVEQGVPATELVEVDAVQDGDALRGGHQRSSSTAARTLSGATSTPQRGSPGASSRTKPTPSRVAFLSRVT